MRFNRRHQRGLNVIVGLLCLGLRWLPALSAENPDLPEELRLPSPWVKTIDARVWSGYADNVLLGNQKSVESPLLAAGLDLTFYRVPLNGWEFVFVSSGEYIRYLTAAEVHQEATAIVQGQVKKSFGQGWQTGLSADYIYFNQVFDASTFEDELQAIPVEAHGVTITPFLGRQIGTDTRLELSLPVTRQFFREFIDDYWEVGPKLTLTRDLGQGGDLALSYQFLDRIHDTRQIRDADGRIESGRILSFYEHELAASWRKYWDGERHWRTSSRLMLRRNEDNGGGFYDYWRPQFTQQIRYQAPSWEVRAEGRVAYYHYDRERIAGLDSPHREKTYLTVSLRGEKSVFKSVKLFAQYEYERALSNLHIDTYEANTYSAGIDCEF
ncbi:MAG: hypothetical protein U1G07_23995 [Verrucomicrobiota bacterium]